MSLPALLLATAALVVAGLYSLCTVAAIFLIARAIQLRDEDKIAEWLMRSLIALVIALVAWAAFFMLRGAA